MDIHDYEKTQATLQLMNELAKSRRDYLRILLGDAAPNDAADTDLQKKHED